MKNKQGHRRERQGNTSNFLSLSLLLPLKPPSTPFHPADDCQGHSHIFKQTPVLTPFSYSLPSLLPYFAYLEEEKGHHEPDFCCSAGAGAGTGAAATGMGGMGGRGMEGITGTAVPM
eukprot:GILI01019616.1.p1 GENE.GILI01019616.1~~GILI01019616.1.p1  ORF type:complete len:117 (+),score=4.95 GILI01019616.1:91-441(+)